MELMGKLSEGQLKALSEIAGNLAVAWFSAGIILPLLVSPESLLRFLLLTIGGLIMAGVFTFISVYLIKETHKS